MTAQRLREKVEKNKECPKYGTAERDLNTGRKIILGLTENSASIF